MGQAKFGSCPVWFQDSFRIVIISGRNQFIPLSDQCYFIVLFLLNYFHASLSKLAWGHLLMTELSMWRIFQTDSQQINITNLLIANLNSDISKINAWVNEWEIIFKPGPSKKVQEIVFSHKKDIPPHWNLMITLVNKYCVRKSMYLSKW